MTTNVYSPLNIVSSFISLVRQSVTSHKFYQQILLRFQGYGFRYLFVVSFITTLIYIGFALYNVTYVISALRGENEGGAAANIEAVMQQLPEISYDGKNITIAEDSPYYIHDIVGNKIAVFDIAGSLSGSDKMQIPFVFTANNVMVNLFNDSDGVGKDSVFVEYSKLFGSNRGELTPDNVREVFADRLEYGSYALILIAFPIMVLLRMLVIILDKSFLCVVIFFVISSMVKFRDRPMKTACRLTIFAAAPALLLQPVILLSIPFVGYLPLLLQFWTMILLSRGIYELTRRRGNFSV